MCGVAGGVALADGLKIDPEVVRRMNHHQRRRGPDGEGLWTAADGRTALGHRRLALIDLSSNGAQPMLDASGRWAVSYNGEIYNHAALRRELEALGWRFRTACDTEVVLYAFAQWGEACLTRLRGMFAFAIYDAAARTLWLARDPFGVKPLYYSEASGRVWFASQARALAECAPIDTRRDPAGLVGFYLFGFVPEPFTWWEGVKLLPAGSVLKIEADKPLGAPRTYFRVEDALTAGDGPRLDSSPLRESLQESVRAHLIADAPVGVFLSAGVDSTAIAMLAAEGGAKLRTVTLTFDEYRGRRDDEAPLAEATARAIRADHQTVRLSRDEVFALIDDFIDAMDQPTTDGLNMFLVSRAAAGAGLKAALSGLGGDELFGGYPTFSRIPKALALARFFPARLGGFIERLGGPICAALRLNPKLAAAANYGRDLESAYVLSRTLHIVRELEELLDESWRRRGLERLGIRAPAGEQTYGSLHAAISALELTRYMRNQLLRDADWASMAHSLEVRVPFLDQPFFSSIAPAIASAAPPSKSDLARACGQPAIAAVARRKTGFATPVSEWLRESSQAGARRHGLRQWAGRIGAGFRALPPRLHMDHA